MANKLGTDAGGSKQGTGEEKGTQNVLLVVLLVLVAGFGYIYFFTGLIKPTQEQKLAEVPPVSQVIKKPLPSPDGGPAKGVAGGATEAKTEVAPPVKPEPVKATPAPAPVVPAPVVKPAVQEAAKPKAEVKKADVAQPAVKKPLRVVAKAGETKPVPVEKKPAVAEKKPAPVEKKAAAAESKAQPAKVVEKKSAAVKKTVKKEPAASGDAVVSGRWTVLVGNYVLEEALATDLARIRKAGLDASIVPGAQKKTHMNRLLLAEFADRTAAQAELDKLKRYTSDAFILDNTGKHGVYAGSYMLEERAASEKERLATAGFRLTLKRADVAIPSKNLTAGSFVEKKTAEDVLKKLRAAGVKATLSH